MLAPLLKGCAPADPALVPNGRTVTPLTPTDVATAVATSHPLQQTQPQTAPTAEAARPPERAPQPSPTAVGPVATVALVKTSDRAFGVRRAIELLDLNSVRGNRVLLKPNYNSADPPPASTHPDVLRALVTGLQDMGARSLTLGERSGMGDTRAVLRDTAVYSLADELGFDTVVFDELDENAWVVRQSGDFHWSSGFAVPRLLLDSECVVQTCNLKTHRYGGHFTLSLKNSVGFVARSVRAGAYNYMEELHNSSYQRQMIAEINAVYTPTLIVMDGVDAFVDGGPAQGKLVSPGVMLAGTDRVAVDAVGVAILRLFGTTPQVSHGRVFEQEQIARAVELGLGIDAPERIQIVTGDDASASFATLIRRFLS